MDQFTLAFFLFADSPHSGFDPTAPLIVQNFNDEPPLARYLCLWASKIPHFNELGFEDRVALLKVGILMGNCLMMYWLYLL